MMDTVAVMLMFGLLFHFTSAERYYATPTSSTQCPEFEPAVPCHTLSQYANKPNDYFASNITLILLPGNHTLDTIIQFSNATIINIQGQLATNLSTISATTVTCGDSAMFVFSQTIDITMSDLVFYGCVNNTITTVKQFTLKDCTLHGQGRNGTGLDLTNVINANILRSTLVENTGKRIFRYANIWWKNGGAIVANKLHNLTILKSTFANNYMKNTQGLARGGAVYVSDSLSISISNSAFLNNTAFSTNDEGSGGAIAMYNEMLEVNTTAISITNSSFINNNVTSNWYNRGFGGAMSVVSRSNPTDLYITGSTFTSNSVTGSSQGRGGAVYCVSAKVILGGSTFINNTVRANLTARGGAIISSGNEHSKLFIFDSMFANNSLHTTHIDGNAVYGGAVCAFLHTNVTIVSTTFTHNTVATNKEGAGGAVLVIARFSIVTVNNSTFLRNALIANRSAQGGAMLVGSTSGTTHISQCMFMNNTVVGLGRGNGGALSVVETTLKLDSCVFTYNSVSGQGAAISVASSNLTTIGILDIQYNIAQYGALYAYNSKLYLSGYTTVSNNQVQGWISYVMVSNMTPGLSNTHQISGQGGMTLYQTEATISGTATFTNNTAEKGGAILLTESKLYVSGDITITSNQALSGGGIYAYQSEVLYSFNKNATVTITGNTALENGGGIYAISSFVKLFARGGSNSVSSLQFISNQAERGGGMYMEANSKLYVIKTRPTFYQNNLQTGLKFDFAYNSAEYGGALYILDDINSGTCQSNSYQNNSQAGECFLQAFRGYAVFHYEDIYSINLNSVNFTNNSAAKAGAVLYGGLLDRCVVSSFAEVYAKNPDSSLNSISATSYLLNITNLQPEDFQSTTIVSSKAVRVCFCLKANPNCSYQPPVKFIRRGQLFNISVVAVDQVNNSIPATIYTSISSQKGVLGIGQAKQSISDSCTDLNYTIFSSLQSHKLLLYASGPCNYTGISQRYHNVEFLPCGNCPVGFKADSDCVCRICASEVKLFINNCSITNGTLQLRNNYWINYTYQRGYTGHQCPFDYCDRSTVNVNLNSPRGSDAQCAFNRSGWLCGECKPGFSLSLGSSRCKSDCSNNWLLLIILFALAGVALVAFLLVCNLTVAIGTINGLVFYANIVEANHAIFFPTMTPEQHPLMAQNPLTVFISWINLDFGIETCFSNGLTAYVKSYLQLTFPFYIIVLVILIIRISKCSSKFSRLLANNPVATLATLILISYAKILRAIISALAFTELKFSGTTSYNNSLDFDDNVTDSRKVWLIDANVDYLRGKHIALFVTAVLLLLVGLVYTFLLLSWQWLYPLLIKSAYLRTSTLIRNTNHFMDAYHAPFKPQHRYWVGLLLLVRVIIYLVSAVNVFGNLHVTLLAIILLTVSLLAYQSLKINVYKQWILSFLETTFFINLIFLASMTFFISDLDPGQESDRREHAQAALAYTSTSIAFVTFIGIISYHTYSFVFKKILAAANGQRRRNTYKELQGQPENGKERKTRGQTKYRTMRGSLELICEEPTAEDYERAASESDPQSGTEPSKGVTYTVIEGVL